MAAQLPRMVDSAIWPNSSTTENTEDDAADSSSDLGTGPVLMTDPAESAPACTKVLGTYELLDAIFIHVPMRDLLLSANRVNKTFNAVISRSMAVNDCFSVPLDGLKDRGWRHHPLNPCKRLCPSDTRKGHEHKTDFMKLKMEFPYASHFSENHLFLNMSIYEPEMKWLPHGTWRHMWFDTSKTKIVKFCWPHIWPENPGTFVRFEKGVTWADVVDYALKMYELMEWPVRLGTISITMVVHPDGRALSTRAEVEALNSECDASRSYMNIDDLQKMQNASDLGPA